MVKYAFKKDIPLSLVVPIVADAAMAGPIADGRLIPVLILDTTGRPEVAELIRVHAHFPPGDVESQWARPLGHDDLVTLMLEFSRPMEMLVPIRFSIERQGVLVDLILAARAAYLQAGKPGDRFAETMDEPRILIELPDTGFQEAWDEFELRRMTEVVRRRTGCSRRAAKAKAREMISRARELAGFRMPTNPRTQSDSEPE